MIKVAVFEDNTLLSDSLTALLHSAEGIHCVGSWENCEKVGKIMQHYQPDIVLMDIEMPVVNGLEGLKIISRDFPGVQVIMLTIFEDDAHLFNSICFGAKGYLLKKATPEHIIAAIHEVAEGGSPMSAGIARKVLQAFSLQQKPLNQDYQLTRREQDILSSLVAGNSYKMIGKALDISINTVRQYIRKVYEKLQVHSMNEAVAKAIREGIV
jgi:DNA-binding NarL/FixJ family response regulator